jgi:DNA-binding PadR family transcriptional regulator
MTRARRPSPQTAAVLAALAEQPGTWRHGYELGQEVGLKAGSLYPILIRLSDRGLLEAAWETDPPNGRPARHLYRLTGAGTTLAAEVAAQIAAEARAAARNTGHATDSPTRLRGAW